MHNIFYTNKGACTWFLVGNNSNATNYYPRHLALGNRDSSQLLLNYTVKVSDAVHNSTGIFSLNDE